MAEIACFFEAGAEEEGSSSRYLFVAETVVFGASLGAFCNFVPLLVFEAKQSFQTCPSLPHLLQKGFPGWYFFLYSLSSSLGIPSVASCHSLRPEFSVW